MTSANALVIFLFAVEINALQADRKRPTARSRGPRRLVGVTRRAFIGFTALIALGVLVLLPGTIAEAHWAGCDRPSETDNSSSQTGHASTQLVPPEVRCTYRASGSLPAETEHHFAAFGVALSAIALLALILPLLYLWALRRVVRRERARDGFVDPRAARAMRTST
jgi:hypothetical protein